MYDATLEILVDYRLVVNKILFKQNCWQNTE